MSIALGFVYSQGVLLAADTQFTAGGSKIDGVKTGSFSASWGRVIGAFTGNVDYASAVFHEYDHLKETKRFKADPLQAMRNVLSRRYREGVFGHPSYQTGDYDYSFLLGVYQHRRPQGGARFYKSTQCNIRPFGGWEASGIGEQYGRDLIKHLYRFEMDNQDAVSLAAYVMSHAGARAQCVSDKFRIHILKHDGNTIGSEELENLTHLSDHMDRTGNWFIAECQRFLLRHTRGTKQDFGILMEILASRATHLRAVWDSIEDARRRPQSTTADPPCLPPWPESPGGSDEF